MITPLEFARKYLGEFKTKHGRNGLEITPKYCPVCRGGKKGDKYTFAMNAETGTWNCKRGSCGATGTFYKLLLDYGEVNITDTYEYRQQQVKRSFKKSTAKVETATNKVIEYLKLRGIGEETCKRYSVGDDGKGNIAFPYIKDDKQVAVKFRPARKVKDGERKMWREEGTDTTTLFGMQTLDGDSLVICEGECDAMAIFESGIKGVVSVPNGSEDLNWIEANWDWLEKFKTIILCGDNDEPGKEMIQKLIAKLGEYRVKVAELPKDCKDANEALVKHGKGILFESIQNAKEIPVAGLVRLADVKALDIEKMLKIKSGIRGLDKTIGGFMMGQISVWTGVNSSGKSTLIGQVLIESLEQGYGICAFSGELPAALFRYWIELQMAGKDSLSFKYDSVLEDNRPYVDSETAIKMRVWYNDLFYLYDNMTAISIENVMKVFEYASRRYDCKVFLVDNLMMLIGGNGDDYYRRQSEFIKAAAAFAKKYDVHIHVVAHPRKINGRLTKMDIAGSGDITNLADNVLGLHRLNEEDKQDNDMKDFWACDAILDVFKNRFSGRQDVSIGLKFDEVCKRFYMPSDDSMLKKQYGWKGQKGDAWEGVDDPCPF